MFSAFRLRLLSGLCLSALTAVAAHAEDGGSMSRLDPVVVSATRLPTPASEVASSVTVVTAEEIETKQLRTMPDILRTVPGLNVVQYGYGGAAAIYMRGTNTNHTKVLLDGIEVSDPSSSDGSFDFSQVNVADIERIEILRGSQSGLYGSDAIGGVISITTKKGDGPAKFNAMAEGGSFGTFNQSAGMRGSEGRVSYAFDIAHNRSTSLQTVPSRLVPAGKDRLDDLSDNKTVSSRLGIDLTDNIDASLIARGTLTDFHNTETAGDAAHTVNQNREYALRGAVHQVAFDGLFDQTLGLSRTLERRQATSAPGAGDYVAYYRGSSTKADWQGNARVAEGETLTVGAETKRDAIEDSGQVWGTDNSASAHVINSAIFAQMQSDWNKRVENTLSVRHDEHSRFGGTTTYREAAALLLPETGSKIKGSVGTGFKAPSLDQLYHTYNWWGQFYYANPNLRPEKSLSFDAGFEQNLSGVRFGSTYFHNDIDNLIDSVVISGGGDRQYRNLNQATTEGFETFIAYEPSKTVSLRADHTFTLAENGETHGALQRRPKHKLSLDGTWKASDDLTLGATMLFTGNWLDVDPVTYQSGVTAKGYVTANLNGSYALNEGLTLFARVNNLLDRRIENPLGYEQPGIGAFGGIKASF